VILPDSFSEWFQRNARKAGLPHIDLRNLRHTYNTTR
jgi:hypothetical protein